MDKREFTRIAFRSEAEVKCGDKDIKGEIENLSLTGAFVKTTCLAPLGKPLQIRIQLSGASSELSVTLKGKLVRQDPRGFAVEFTEMALDSFFHLRTIIAAANIDEASMRTEYASAIRDQQD